ncbi:MAG: response regulator [Bacteroidota bacterium]
MRRPLRLLTLLFLSGIQHLAGAQQPLTLQGEVNLAQQPEAVFYGIADAAVTDPHPANIRFRPISTFDELFSKTSDQSLWRKLSIQTVATTDFIIDFGKHDLVDLFVYQGPTRLDHLRTGYLLHRDDRQIGSDNIIHLHLEPNTSYDLYVKTTGVLNPNQLSLKIHTLDTWILRQQGARMFEIGFLVFLFGAIAYTLFKYFQKRLNAYLCFGSLMVATLLFFGYSSGLIPELAVLSRPEHARYLMTALLIAPFCHYHMLQQSAKQHQINFGTQLLLKWTAIANLVMMIGCILALTDLRLYAVVVEMIRYTFIANAALGYVVAFTLWKDGPDHRKYFLIGSLTLMTGLLAGALFWSQDAILNLSIAIGTLLHFPFLAYSLGMIGDFAHAEAPNTYVEELKENQQMIERQKQDLATQIDELSQKLGGAMQEVEHSEKVKDDFLSIMSHEIRTPLNAIVGLTHLISKEESIGEIKRNIGTLERSVDALLGLIDDVLDFNKIYTGQLQLENIDFDLHETIKKIAKGYKRSAAQKNIQFEFNFDPLIPIHVGGDAFRLTQVLDNLLGNAIKFTEEGTIRLTAKYLSGHQSEKVRVEFEIEDSGMGIAPDDLTKIFDRFQQGDPDISRKYGESGLALSIAKALISMMGCDFQVKSHTGQGSVFSFVLEFERSGPEDKTTKRMEQIEEGVPQGLRILVVDDNEMNRMILNQFLSKWGIEADDAENGKEAFEKIIKNSYDLVLLDLQMPIMDGYELTKLIRSNEMLRDLPIIAISADSISNVYEEVTAAGMNDFIVKPLNPADLKQKIAVYSHNLQMHSIYSR